MPPPDYIPSRTAETGPQPPMSATELYFPTHHAASERPASGPQRVIRVDATAQGGGASATNATRTGPIRPAVFSLKVSGTEDGAPVEKKERVMGGARRELRMPEATEPAPNGVAGADEKGKAAAAAHSKAIRPRVISTSKSTPAIPLQTALVKEEATRVKKLASSAGASSRSGTSSTTATATPAAKLSRTASATTLTQPTVGSRARIVEKA